jgi:hypothetical protein
MFEKNKKIKINFFFFFFFYENLFSKLYMVENGKYKEKKNSKKNNWIIIIKMYSTQRYKKATKFLFK